MASGGAAGVGCGVSDEDPGVAGEAVLAWDDVAAAPPPLLFAPPHPNKIANEITAARACIWPPRMSPSGRNSGSVPAKEAFGPGIFVLEPTDCVYGGSTYWNVRVSTQRPSLPSLGKRGPVVL